tara:strand:- start:845 stop:1051 length:207 start_codon:yes stop_codon:yes gene_type:complete
MNSSSQKYQNLAELIDQLNKDRSWLLEQLDRGNWPDLRPDLAALERELGQLVIKASEAIDRGFDIRDD